MGFNSAFKVLRSLRKAPLKMNQSKPKTTERVLRRNHSDTVRLLLVEGQRNTARLIGCFRNFFFLRLLSLSLSFDAPKTNSTVGQRVHFHFSIYKVFTHYGMIYYIPLVRAVNDQNECEKNCCGVPRPYSHDQPSREVS